MFTTQTQEETPRWRAYEVQQSDAFGYGTAKYGVREEYEDGATRYIHNVVFDTREEAEQVAAKFHINSRKGMTYDNVMKQWR
jgi:hypothetical protein